MPDRRVAIGSVALAIVTAVIVSAGLSGVPGVSALSRAVRPVTAAAGLEQNWNMFAPEPRRVGVALDAMVTWSDGARTSWTPPEGDPLLGAYRDYRWRKWLEHASSDAEGAWLWRPAARYIVRTLPPRPSAAPVEVRLFRSVRRLAAPGTSGGDGWVRSEVYRAQLAPPTP